MTVKTIQVQCTFVIDVVVDATDGTDHIRYLIEQNGCPGTGVVGAKFDDLYEQATAKNVCWACNLKGQNKIIGGLDDI